MSRIAIIPARGGSKRIPRKNIKNFLGKPIIEYSIQAAIQSNLFDEIMVSTDDEEISETAKKAGAQVPFLRSIENSNDTSTTADVLLEVLHEYDALGMTFSQALCLYPCAPFTTASLISDAFNLLNAEDFHCVYPVVEYSPPIQRALELKNGIPEMKYPEFEFVRSQDIEKTYFDAGQFYLFNVQEFLDQKTLRMNHSKALVMNRILVQDIDDEIDWKLAELKYQLLFPEFKS